jgi:hypothetical protein
VQLTNRGIVLGKGIILAPLMRRADGAAALQMEGREAQIFALLSLAQGRPIHPNVLHGFYGVAKSLEQGDPVAAMIRPEHFQCEVDTGSREENALKQESREFSCFHET